MANTSTLTDASYSALKQRVSVYAILDMKGAADPVLMKWTPQALNVAGSYAAAATTAPSIAGSAGTQLAATIKRNSTGNFTLTLQSGYQRLMFGGAWFSVPSTVNTGLPNCAGAYEVTPSGGIDAPGTVSSVNFCTVDFAGALADPTDATQMKLLLVLDASGVL